MPPIERESWIRTQTEQFEILSSADARQTLAIAEDLSRFAQAVRALTDVGPIRTPLPTRMFIFGSREHFRRFVRNPNVGGLMVAAPNASYLLIDASNPDRSLEVARHEFVHFVLASSNRGPYPAWYDEGLAELLSTLVIAEDHLELGGIPSGRGAALSLGSPLSTTRMLTATDLLRWERHALSQFYAQAWAMVHYLTIGDESTTDLDRAERTRRLVEYLRATREGAPVEPAWRGALGRSVAEFDREILRYVDRGRFAVVRIASSTFDQRAVTPEPPSSLERAQLLGRLGELAMVMVPEDPAFARGWFERALREEPALELAQRGLLRLRLLEGDVTARELEQLRTYARRALSQDPDDVASLVDLGQSYALAGREELEPGIRALERAHELAPASRSIRLTLAQLLLRAQRQERAALLLRPLIGRAHEAPGSSGDGAADGATSLEALLTAAGIDPIEPDPLYHQEARLSLDSPRPGARVESPVALIEVTGSAGFGEIARQDVLVAIDESGSTRDASGVDLDGDGFRGTGQLDLNSGFPLYESSDPGDAVIVAERRAARRLIEQLNPELTRVGLLTFGERARLRAPLGPPSAALAELSREHEINPVEATSFSAALERALAHFEEARLPGERRRRILVLLSDGVPTAENSLASVARLAQRMGVQGIEIQAAGMGREALSGANLYEYLARATGGRYLRVEQPGDVVEILGDLRLNGLQSVEILNRSTAQAARAAVRIFADGSFDGFVPLTPGPNEIEIAAQLTHGQELRERRVIDYRPLSMDAPGARAEASEMLSRLRARTQETALAREIEAQLQLAAPADPRTPEADPRTESRASSDADEDAKGPLRRLEIEVREGDAGADEPR